jgi:hypothetical protein
MFDKLAHIIRQHLQAQVAARKRRSN